MKKISSALFVVLILFFLFPSFSKTLAKTETSGDLQVIYDEPLFPNSIIWHPGLSATKSFTVKNLGSSLHTVSIEATNTSQTGNIADVFLFKITEGNKTRYGEANSKTLRNFWDDGQISLSNLDGRKNTTYDLTITMLFSAGNEYQGKKAVFDLIIGFVDIPYKVVITGARDVSGTTAATCSDTPPSSAPTLTSAIPGVNSVTLTWTQAGDPISYYLVAFGTTSGSYTYGNPNVGAKGTNSYTISGLSGGITYYFVVRAGNGCAPGPFSNELSATPTGGFLTSIPSGFAPEILGIATPEAELTTTPSGILTTPKGKIEGEKAPSKCQTCLWWQILLGEFIALILYYYLILKKYSQKIKKPSLISLIIPTITYLIFLWLNKNCLTNFIFIKSTFFFCRYFLVFDLLVYLFLIF